MDNPSCFTTSSPREPRPTSASQRRSFMAQRKALGRGLSALLGTPTPETEVDSEKLREIDIDRIVPNTQQPRKYFSEEALNELADSIRAHGLIQPIIVQPLPDNLFQLIAGERRWRGAPQTGLTEHPTGVRVSPF